MNINEAAMEMESRPLQPPMLGGIVAKLSTRLADRERRERQRPPKTT
jgi:hypothetical protein